MNYLNSFKTINAHELSDNVFGLLDKDWALIAAGNKDSYNMMTASWGGFGCLWGKDVCFVVIRRSRHTFEFVEKSETLSLNFFDENYRDVLTICGKKSGRDIDKMKDVPLSPFSFEDRGIAFDEARLVMNCKKLAAFDAREFDFIDKSVMKFYEDDDYHKLYICELKEILIKE